jgi:hypothetical protein
MRLTLFPDESRLLLRFETTEEARRFFTDARDQHGFLLHLEHRLKPFQKVDIAVEAPSLAFTTQAEVVQMFPGAATIGTAFSLTHPDAPLAALDPAQKTASGPRAVGPDATPASIAGKRAAADAETSPFYRIKEMNPTERFRLTTKASRAERAILIRDSSPQVLLGLLNHPRIEDAEVLELIKSNYASAGILQRVADSRKWMANRDIRSTVVRSAKTPPLIAIKHLDALPTRELGVLAKSGQTREQLRKAALKLYLKRTGRPGT